MTIWETIELMSILEEIREVEAAFAEWERTVTGEEPGDRFLELEKRAWLASDRLLQFHERRTNQKEKTA